MYMLVLHVVSIYKLKFQQCTVHTSSHLKHIKQSILKFFDLGSRSRLVAAFSAAASADFVVFRPTKNRERPPENRGRPARNRD